MAIIQISKIQQRSGNLVNLPQLDEAQFGWANDTKQLFIGATGNATTDVENVEVLTTYSTATLPPGGGNTQIQFNNGGVLGGIANFTLTGGGNTLCTVSLSGNLIVGNIAGSNLITSNNINVGETLTSNLITSNSVNSGTLTISGISNLGNVGNIVITGGSNGQVLSTNGNGSLSWSNGGGGNGTYGDSNVIALMSNFASNPIVTNGNITTKYLINSVGASISANGSISTDATVLGNTVNIITSVSSGQGVILPTAIAGMTIYITNTSTDSLLVYPASGATINELSTNAALTQSSKATLHYVAASSTQWYSVGSTYA
jgi:hypothetical protein